MKENYIVMYLSCTGNIFSLFHSAFAPADTSAKDQHLTQEAESPLGLVPHQVRGACTGRTGPTSGKGCTGRAGPTSGKGCTGRAGPTSGKGCTGWELSSVIVKRTTFS